MNNPDTLLDHGRKHLFPTYRQAPVLMVRGEGPWLIDAQGRRYIDLSGGLTVNAVGHAHPKLTAAVAEQAGRLMHISNLFYNDATNALAEALVRRSFGDRVFFCNSGAEANEAAIKLARRYFYARNEDRHEIIAMDHSFHGRTMGALAATGQPKYHEGFQPLPPGFRHVRYGDIDQLRAAITPRTALVMLEPLQGEAGVILPPPGYLRAVRELCDKHGILLHFDEVQVGMGRTGRWFCYEHEGVVPDTMSLAKALGGGLPLGALIAREEKAACLVPGTHASTFGGNPVSCAAGLAYIELVESERLLERCAQVGERMLTTLREQLSGLPMIREIRGRGCILGIETDRPSRTFLDVARERGVLFAAVAETVIRLAPPFNIPFDVLDEGISTIVGILRDAR